MVNYRVHDLELVREQKQMAMSIFIKQLSILQSLLKAVNLAMLSLLHRVKSLLDPALNRTYNYQAFILWLRSTKSRLLCLTNNCKISCDIRQAIIEGQASREISANC